MNKKYLRIVLPAAFLLACGVAYGITRLNDGTEILGEAGGMPSDVTVSGETVSGRTAGKSQSSGSGAAYDSENAEKDNFGDSSGKDGTFGTGEAADRGDAAESEPSDGQSLYVHVCGEISLPGVYELPAGSRIFEAIDAAGGLTENASDRSLNMAAMLEDGMQIIVPSKQEAASAEAVSAEPSKGGSGISWVTTENGGGAVRDGGDSLEAGAAGQDGAGGLVNLNTATKEELMALPGIGESRAEDIIRYREESGGFSAIEDIMKVSGIKSASFKKLKDLITV